MESTNTITLTGVNRTAVFEIKENSSIWNRPFNEDGTYDTFPTDSFQYVINIDAKKPAVSGGLEYDSAPSVMLSWIEDFIEPENLVGRTIEIPNSFDARIEDHVTEFYYFEHLEFDNVKIRFVEHDAGCFRIQVTGTAPDPTNRSAVLEVKIDTIVQVTER